MLGGPAASRQHPGGPRGAEGQERQRLVFVDYAARPHDSVGGISIVVPAGPRGSIRSHSTVEAAPRCVGTSAILRAVASALDSATTGNLASAVRTIVLVTVGRPQPACA
jgi:hypothetical protein